ncbi:FtsK/SpoIIIE family DNA translocase [Eubacterium oxidoreducens]|uniref:DNA segregation ATPase FtsK/SpoIIIE, S-DNA-T family n=1 Tax=Eubacterium oxidoreducens TaxID=1732 RepID=A0A1G6ALB4_EUBOX|nr:DNA translocase FtsK [Eubacterium oxidoreducens]SDB09100.1 DNA segregation ATPase FtsK/SpoIIIE, S-DNA-T family [Eubacterium oxidoreducens]
MAAKKKSSQSSKKRRNKKKNSTVSFKSEVSLWLILGISVFLFICNFGIGGKIGTPISYFFFGLFGLLAFIFPIVLFVGSAFYLSNKDNLRAIIKLVACFVFFIFLCVFLQLILYGDEGATLSDAYFYCGSNKTGGGVLGSAIANALVPNIGRVGAFIVDFIVLIICLVFITEKSIFDGLKNGGERVYSSAMEEHEFRSQIRQENAQKRRDERRMKRREKYARGVTMDTDLKKANHETNKETEKNESPILFSELSLQEEQGSPVSFDLKTQTNTSPSDALTEVTPQTHFEPVNEIEQPIKETITEPESLFGKNVKKETLKPTLEEDDDEFNWESNSQQGGPVYEEEYPPQETLDEEEHSNNDQATKEAQTSVDDNDVNEDTKDLDQWSTLSADEVNPEGVAEKAGTLKAAATAAEAAFSTSKKAPSTIIKYKFPPVSLLCKAKSMSGDSKARVQELGDKLIQTLKSFGVNVKPHGYSQGPAVTRYEVEPEMGVKVSKILNLADDIQLNLAAKDIRIEAPIPGKALIGIEIPNEKNSMVSFRELIESETFKNHNSKIAFAAGKDISGEVIVADIAKMPHILIAGSTGSGKSVCINTIVMSILYHADPNDVKLIMVDPKVVELSVYNGIPHLAIPVVTDPKKAAAALNWAVAEMTKRYNKFAEMEVRNIAGFNEKVEAGAVDENGQPLEKMYQLVIIVDELADLMMVSASEVEDSICRLAQLARAAGIHLVIATQRPSVNVITGLIKANMPSRIAFAVSSSIDSRTILDSNGAEKLLGKGDMLYFPQGYSKPLRVQGAFVSDDEVKSVVDYIKKQYPNGAYDEAAQQGIEQAHAQSNMEGTSGTNGSDLDVLFTEIGFNIAGNETVSIGSLQRNYRIGFNRAARIIDQLTREGVVGPERGTKPREVLMSKEEFAAKYQV